MKLYIEHEERIALFHEAGKKDADFPFGPFHKYVILSSVLIFAKTNIILYRALRINDEFIGIQSSKILTLLIWYCM